MTNPTGAVTAQLQLRRGGDAAQVLFRHHGHTVTVAIPEAGSGGQQWSTTVERQLHPTRQLQAAHGEQDQAALWDAYRAADQAAWVAPLTRLRQQLAEFDEHRVVLLPQLRWRQRVQAWPTDLEDILRAGSHTYHPGSDTLAVSVPAGAAEWLRVYYPLPGRPGTTHAPGHPDDRSETLALALALWSRTGGTLASLSDALTTARHATFEPSV